MEKYIRFFLGDIVRMKKNHPCGNDQWEVVKLGTDIKIRCLKCGRNVMLHRRKFEKSVKEILKRGTEG
ncbi:MAG: DUF951 domain-containing protein [Clostridia bacterium]|nr:DUF951 domain-containing protein [Clostridia bacterium]